jgi:hypothetical protein
MKEAITSLSALILTIQGDGDIEKSMAISAQYGVMTDDLKAALKRIEDKDIPVDIVFDQGLTTLGLN